MKSKALISSLVAGATLCVAGPAAADRSGVYQARGWHSARHVHVQRAPLRHAHAPVHRIVHRRPVVVHRRVIVERPIYIARPAYASVQFGDPAVVLGVIIGAVIGGHIAAHR